MIDLPPSLTRLFRGPEGRTDYFALLRTPNDRLVALARRMTEDEWAGLYARLRGYRPGLFERLAASAAGIDLEATRRRFLSVLEAAAAPVSV